MYVYVFPACTTFKASTHGAENTNLGHLEEQSVLLIAQPSLQTQQLIVLIVQRIKGELWLSSGIQVPDLFEFLSRLPLTMNCEEA